MELNSTMEGVRWETDNVAPGLVVNILRRSSNEFGPISFHFDLNCFPYFYCGTCGTSICCHGSTVREGAHAVYKHHHNMVSTGSPVPHSTESVPSRANLTRIFEDRLNLGDETRIQSTLAHSSPVFPKVWVQGLLGDQWREENMATVSFCLGCFEEKSSRKPCSCDPGLNRVEVHRLSLGRGRSPIYVTEDSRVLDLQGQRLGNMVATSSSSSSSSRLVREQSPAPSPPPPPVLAPNSSWTPVQPAGPMGRFSNAGGRFQNLEQAGTVPRINLGTGDCKLEQARFVKVFRVECAP